MDELISEFLAETSEGLSVLDLELVRLEQEPNNQEILGNIFRVMHTIKGTCGFLGLSRLEKVAHAGENILGKVRDGKLTVTPYTVSMVLQAIDRIKMIIVHLESNGSEPEGDDKELTDKLNACAEGEAPTEAASETQAPIAVETPEAAPASPIEEIAAQDNTPPEPAIAEASPTPAPPSPAPAKAAGPKPKETEGAKPAATNANQTIRVNLDVLEGLMQMVSELVLTRNQLLQILRTSKDNAFSPPLQRLNHITSDLQERVMKTRMQPISNAWSPFPRLIRDLSVDLGKKIDLKQIGGETELDRQLLELIKDPFTHMVRNSADHGIERPEDRKAAGKPEAGTITLKAYHEGGHIIVEIGDDGKGISSEKIKQKAIEKGLSTEQELESMSESQILQFIFQPGFSTAEKVTSVSGRGVGMDVVKTNIEKISGTIELKSTEGKGSTFKIKIPLTLAIMPVLIMEAGNQRFAIPQANVIEMVRTDSHSENKIEYINEAPILRLRGKLLPLITLTKILGLTAKEPEKGKVFVVVCELGGHHFGLIVDRVFDTEEIVVKPVAPVLQNIDVYSGCTILGDGSVIMILDPNGLLKTAGQLTISREDTSKEDEKLAATHEKTRFLLFDSGNGAPKAIPLELVSRLEEIDMGKVETTNNGPVLQYRDDLMFLAQLEENATLPTSGIHSTIVFSDHNLTLGLVVSAILDIVEHEVDITTKSGADGFLGNIVIKQKTYDLVDVGHFFRKRFAALFAKESAKTSDNVQKPTILFVDDSPFFRKFIPPALAAAGYQVVTAEDPEKALSILEQGKKFAAIVTDLNMPIMNGTEFAKRCRNDNVQKDTPVIALSSQTTEQMEFAEDMSVLDAFVSKTNHTLLLETIARLLHEPGHRMEGAA